VAYIRAIERLETVGFAPYLPRLAREWRRDAGAERAQVVDGTLASVDLSGFTSLSERLAARGRAGAEELILAISGCFEALIGIATRHGGDVLKFRGDALLLLFHGAEHERRACRAAAEMQWFIEHTGTAMSSVGEVRLRMATGVYTGPCHFFVVGTTHRELVVTGPAASATVRLEDAAEAGEVLVSAATAAALPPETLGGERDGARLLVVDRLVLEPGLDPHPHRDDDAADSEGELESYVPAPLRDHLAVEAEEGEHRQVTAAFVKWSGTDELLQREGVEAVLERLDRLGHAVGETADELGVTWLESDVDVNGGKLYLVAGAPASAGADEERMLRAVRRALDADTRLELRAGVNRGPVFAGDIGALSRRTYAVVGDTVNLAARLTARAQPGQILATADVLDRSRTTFESTHQPFLVKGKERPVTAYSIGAIVGVRADERQRDLPLVGRERELELLGTAVDAVRRRTTQVVEIVGEPGIGKSRLVEELRARALGFQQLVARCEQYESSNAFFAVRSLLRPLVGITPEQSAEDAGDLLAAWIRGVMPDLAPWLPLLAIPFDARVEATPEADAIDPAFRRDRLHESLEQFLTRVLLMPTLIVIEDAHWIDDASRFLLRHLAVSQRERPWLVCVTRRPEGEAVAPDHGVELELAPLSGEEARRLALAAAGDRAVSEHELGELGERSGGNPLFVAALAAAGGAAGPLPDSVESLLNARIDRLDPGDRLLLRHASVIGAAFDLDLVRDVVGAEHVDADVFARWQRLGEFVHWEGSERLAFRHDLFRSTAYAGLSFRRRREIHGRVGEALERRAGDDVDEAAGLLSLHFAEAERHEPAWRYAVIAGDRARERYANVVAAELYERALAAAEHLPALDPRDVARLAEALGDVSELFASYDRAAAGYARASTLLAGDAAATARLTLKRGVLHERSGEYEAAIESYEEALADLDGLAADEAVAVRTEIELAYAGVRFRQGRHEESIAWSERAAAHAEEAGELGALAHAYYLLDAAHFSGLGNAHSRSYLDRALRIYEELDDLSGQGIVLNNLGIHGYFEGRWSDALELYERSRDAKQRTGDVIRAALQDVNIAEILSDQGRLEEAEQTLETALRVFRAAGYSFGVAVATGNLGRAAARAGRFDDAHRLLAEAAQAFEEIGSQSFLLETHARRAEAFVLAGEHRQARALAEETLRRAEEAESAGALLAFLERLCGLAALQGGDKEPAAAHLAASERTARSSEARYELALALEAEAELARRGGPGDPDALAAEARTILEGLGVVAMPRIPLL
jgi:class 3 adenylate cyclase/tetratricopeptide (TPR) repeat protein